MHAYEVTRRKDHRGVDLISDALPFGRLWYARPDAAANAIGRQHFIARSHGEDGSKVSTKARTELKIGHL
jgi:hypothetical protein